MAVRRRILEPALLALLLGRPALAGDEATRVQAPPREGAADRAAGPSAAPDERLTTGVFRPRDPGFLLGYDLLRLPEFTVRLVLTPTFPLVYWAESVALDARVEDVLMNDERTSLWLPTATFFGNDAPGFGVRYTHEDVAGHEEHLMFAASLKTNGDRSLALGFMQALAFFDERALALQVGSHLDHNERFYGIGGDTLPGGAQALRVDQTRIEMALELGGPSLQSAPLRADTRLAYLSRRDAPGSDAELAPAGPDATIAGFGGAARLRGTRGQPDLRRSRQ